MNRSAVDVPCFSMVAISFWMNVDERHHKHPENSPASDESMKTQLAIGECAHRALHFAENLPQRIPYIKKPQIHESREGSERIRGSTVASEKSQAVTNLQMAGHILSVF